MRSFFFVLLILFAACDQRSPRAKIDKPTSQASQSQRHSDLASDPLERPQDSVRLRSDSIHRLDSIEFVKAEKKALSYAYVHGRSSYTYSFISVRDTTFQMTTSLRYGRLLTGAEQYLILNRSTGISIVVLDVYVVRNGKLDLLCSDDGGMEYIGNYLRDVNGDGYKDVLVHWYPSSGCCRRNVYHVFLYQPRAKTLSPVIELINPTFYPRESTIRGILYGHPGEVPLYKYRWKGSKLDTVEFIHPLANKKHQYVKTTRDIVFPTEKDGILLKSIPREYLSIEDLDWFTWTEPTPVKRDRHK